MELTEQEIIEKYPFFTAISPFVHQKYKEFLYENVELLYHYTNLDGLIGIIKTKGFWASQIKYMNDSKEYLHGLSICNNIISQLKDQTISTDQVQFLEKVDELLNNGDSENFVVSFCPNGDLLSQWRGYSRGQYGVSIGFSVSELFQLRTQRDAIFYPQKVVYDIEIQNKIITTILGIGLKHTDLKGYYGFIIPKEIAKTLKYYIPLFKDASFSEENEYRAVITNFDEASGKYPIYFRPRNNIILPYVEVSLNNPMDEKVERLPIKKIIVGPSDTSEFTIESVKYFLNDKKYPSLENVVPSKIPYR